MRGGENMFSIEINKHIKNYSIFFFLYFAFGSVFTLESKSNSIVDDVLYPFFDRFIYVSLLLLLLFYFYFCFAVFTNSILLYGWYGYGVISNEMNKRARVRNVFIIADILAVFLYFHACQNA